MDTTDAINGSLIVDSVGDRHWLKYPNGSVLIVGELVPCRWTSTPKRGLYEKNPLDIPSNVGYPGSLDTVMFDNADHPARAVVYSTQELIKSRTIISDWPLVFTGRQPTAPRLKSAFPGLKNLVLIDGVRGGGGWEKSKLRPQHFSGVVVRVFKLHNGADCGAAQEGGIVVIGQESPCRDVRTNCDIATGDFVCGRYIRNLDTAYDDRLANVQVLHATLENPGFKARYLSTDLILAQAGITEFERTKSGWQPRICYKSYCRNGGDFTIYDRETHEVLTVWVSETSFDPSVFTPEVKGYVEH